MNLFAHAAALLVTALVWFVPGLAYWLGVPMQERETIERMLQWPSGSTTKVLELSNITGNVRIVAEDRQDVAVSAVRTEERRALAADAAAKVDFRQQGERILVCGDARYCGCHREARGRDVRDEWDDWDDDRTRVRVDFEVKVPRTVTLDVCTINNSSLRVEGTSGAYTLRNVNGDVTMTNVRGQGLVRTVNGDIDATFAAVPGGPAGFKTVNGRIDVTLPPGLAADLRLRTLRGELLTNFETTEAPARQAASERSNGRYVYRSNRFTSVRIGGGGPELTFETVNGDVRVRKQQ
jgi:hypothetical protein